MQAHGNAEELQDAGCCALKNLAVSASDIGTKILNLGGIKAILKSLQTHIQSENVQKAACKALGLLVAGAIDNKAKIIKLGRKRCKSWAVDV